MIKKTIQAAFFAFILFSGISHAQETPSPEDIAVYRKDLDRIEDYLNNLNTLVASFNQVDSDGNTSEGTFYLSRPGKLRWEYLPPTPILIVAKGSIMAYYDSELDQLSHVSIDSGLSGFLTRKVISFSDANIAIVKFEKTDDEISVTITKNKHSDEGQLTLVFTNKELSLKKMEMLDAIGKVTTVYFTKLIYGKELDDKLFALPRTKIRR